MTIRHLPAQTRAERLWRNGGGATCDVAVFPDGAGDEDFLWRASIATISGAGPFSVWPGVDRSLLVLEGWLALAIEGRGETVLDESAAVFTFAGEDQVVGRPLDGACRVFNLMTRRGQTQIRRTHGSTAFPVTADQTLLLATQATTIRVDGQCLRLDMADALLLELACGATWEADRTFIVAEFSAGAGRQSEFPNADGPGI